MRALLLLMLSACGPSFAALRPVANGAGVSVELERVRHQRSTGPGGTLFGVTVENHSPAPIIVDRDAVTLLTPSGARARLPGGWSRFYSIAPGARHQVRCLYVVRDLRAGESVQLSFAGAITQNSAPVAVEPLEFVVR